MSTDNPPLTKEILDKIFTNKKEKKKFPNKPPVYREKVSELRRENRKNTKGAFGNSLRRTVYK